MVKQLLLFTLALAFCFPSSLSAQEAEQQGAEAPAKVQKRKGKKKRGEEKQKAALGKRITKGFGKVELTDDQKEKLKQLIEKHFEDISAIKKKVDGYISKDDRKELNKATAAARKEGKKWAEATKIGHEAIGLSEEDQKAVVALNKERNSLHAKIKEAMVASFTDEQKEAMKKKIKNKKGKKNKKKEIDTASFSPKS
jgi:hypothetical protein